MMEVYAVCAFKFKTGILKTEKSIELQKTKTAQQYCGLRANIDNKNNPVLCSWYISSHDCTIEFCIMLEGENVHDYLPLRTSSCTLSSGCFELHVRITEGIEASDCIMKTEKSENLNAKLITSKKLILKEGAEAVIRNLFQGHLANVIRHCKIQEVQVSKGNKLIIVIRHEGNMIPLVWSQ